ncbi:RNA-binding protein [Haloferula helveola]|uniref:RNA-binding protein n=1 Tax=Haloferula helveola TaxID=490095 RepID=A0ABN6HDP5_9BACT|nr:RNA-binding protein [Haloferula helveola]
MSNATSENRGNGEGQRRRRSRGGRNRNRNRQGGNREGNAPKQGGNQQGGNRQGGGRNRQGGNRQRRRAPKPKPLTWWQKLLKAIGLYKEPTPPARTPKSNTRNARTEDGPKSDGPKKSSKPKQKRERKSEDTRGPISTDNVETKRLYLGNLSYEATESDLEELFRGVGTVRRVEIVYNRKTHRSKGYGFVDMLNVDEAKRAVEVLHEQFFMGRKLDVSGAKSEGPVETEEPKAEEKTVQQIVDEAPAPEPAAVEETPEPVAETTPEPVAEAAPEPAAETTPEPAPEPEAPAAEESAEEEKPKAE